MDLTRVIIFTPDVIRLADFYRKCFDIEPHGEGSEEWAEFTAGGCSLAFHRYEDETAGRDGWVKIVFGAKDVIAEKARLESLGVEMSDVVELGSIQLCDGRDPDGNWFQISSRGL